MPKIIDNISNLKELMQAMTDLDDPNYLSEQGILLEEVDDIKEALRSELAKYSDQVQSYIEYKLKQRQENLILSTGIADQIKTLSERKQAEDGKIENADKWIDYICQFAGITGLKTPMGEIKYTGGEKMKVAEGYEYLIPEDLRNRVFVTQGQTYLEEQKLRDLGYEEVVKLSGLPEIKKRYNLQKKSWEEKTEYLGNMLKANAITQEEHDRDLQKIKEEQKRYEGKIWIDDSKSISIK